MGRALTEARVDPAWNPEKHMKGYRVIREETDLTEATDYCFE
jgi:hypothetical protein